MMRFLLPLLLLLPLLASAQPKEGASQTPAQANKQLFDRTVDELNFRTFETVYDKHFTRQKYPPSLRTAAARKEFTGFEGNAELQRLFANYNGVAERYKTRFGGGPLTLAEFEKQLGGVLRDRNFEFFIRGLPLDEKRSLIRTEQRVIKQAAAQFNASGSAAPPAGPEPEEPLAPAAPLTTHGPLPQENAGTSTTPTEAATTSDEAPLTSAAPRADAPAGSGPGWVGYLTLLLSLGSFGLLLYTVGTLLPEMRRLRRQVRALEATPATFYPEAEAGPDYPAPDYPAPDEPATPRPSLLSRLRPQRTTELPADQYDEDEEPEDGEPYDGEAGPSHPRR